MREALECRVMEAIRKGKWSMVTRPLSWCYSLVVRGRNRLYDRGWLRQKHAPLPVVSIGNLVVGGVGKTQVTLLLARALEDVAILSRGYRGGAERAKNPLVVSPERERAQESGDEPWLLASRLPDAHVIVNRDRYTSALEAEKLGARLCLLDDGMQHRRLFRDIEIVVLGGADPFGSGSFLPRGFLREDPKRLARADLVVFVGKPSPGIKERVARLSEGAPSVETEICVTALRMIGGEVISSLEGKKVGLFCAIGNPHRFVTSIEEKGAEVVASHFLPDHRTIGKREFETFAARCRASGAEYLLCTEKDRVKLPSFAAASPLPVGWAEVELEIVENRKAWDRMLKEIRLLV